MPRVVEGRPLPARRLRGTAGGTHRNGTRAYFSVTRTRRGSAGATKTLNGLLRQYFPKGTDLSYYSQAELDAVADPAERPTTPDANWMTPAEKLDEFLLKPDDALTD